jgi:lactate racemase
MPTNLAYGKQHIAFDFDENLFDILGKNEVETALSDAEIGEVFDNPFDAKTLEEIINPSETVLIVVPDATRASACGQIVNLLVRRLIANGTMPFDIRIIFAVGIHRQPTEAEKKELLTPFIFQRIKHLDHNPRDLVQLVKLGFTKRGTPIELNRALLEHEHVITVGSINWHYFAGFGGGRKLICPGLASSRTINETHKLAFDFDTKNRREGVGIGMSEGNAVHEEFIEIVSKINPSFSINSITNGNNEATKIFCGNWKTSHEAACQYFADNYSIEVAEKREVVIVSCGGFPHDLNIIQAHKALENASNVCEENGTIIWLAECTEGLGKSDFLKWFEHETSKNLAETLSESYQVNGQTAWSLLKKAEKFKVVLISNLPQNETSKMKLKTARNLDEAIAKVTGKKGYVLPFGAKYFVKT